jgi:solute carrier family 39 (zinc transporter), member 1/2/3
VDQLTFTVVVGDQRIDILAEGHGVSTSFAAQMIPFTILEFGIIFHSSLVGLTLAVSGEEFIVLYIVLTFHQTFEGVGLGARLATMFWPDGKRWLPYALSAAYSLSTPISLAVGLGVRQSFEPGSHRALVVSGIFDSISAGILLYAGLVQLIGHDFFTSQMRDSSLGSKMGAVGWMCLGAGLMALLGNWA